MTKHSTIVDMSGKPVGVFTNQKGWMIEPGQLYTRDEVARYFGVNKRTLARWEAQGIGPRVTRIGLTVYYRGEVILDEIDRGTK
jgi:hypothetical protein